MNADAELFNNALEYFPETGAIRWKISPAQRVPADSVAGCISGNGYWMIKYHRHIYLAHRLAWLLMTGEWPVHQIDHKNNIKSDNRWANLREANQSQNRANSKKYGKYPKGVTLTQSGTFQAQCNKHYLGIFSTPEEAHAAYITAAKKYFGEFARVL